MTDSRLALNRVSTVDALVAAVRAHILDGGEEPGAPLREQELCASYGVSRHSLRVATQRLVHEGLLRHEPNRGVFVPILTSDDVADLYVVRTALECEATRLIVTRSLDVSRVLAAVERLEAIPSGTSWRDVLDADLAFHHAIVAAPESPRAARIFASLQGELQLCFSRFPGEEDPATTAAAHRELYVALTQKRPHRAVAVLRAHLEDGCAALLRSGSF